jgi:hypothetical protein
MVKFYCDCLWRSGDGENFNWKVGVPEIAEMTKVYSYLHFVKKSLSTG